MVLNLYGTGGMGKSSLLEHFRSIAARNANPFLLLDSRDFPHNPVGFVKKLLEFEIAGPDEILPTQLDPVEEAIYHINHSAEKARLVLAIDTYEEMNDMDHWLRTTFLPRLSERVLLILSGRYRLGEEWTAAPSWRKMIYFLPLPPFDLPTCQQYAVLCGVMDDSRADRLYTVTQGHPLTLSLLIQKPGLEDELTHESTELAEVFHKICSRWLREIPNPDFQRLIEAASLIRIFNQEHLEWILQTRVESPDFERLIALSFMRRSRRGWFIHDGLRRALLHDFRLRKPQEYRRFQERSTGLYSYPQRIAALPARVSGFQELFPFFKPGKFSGA